MSGLVNVSDVPNVCITQVEVAFTEPWERCLVMVCYIIKCYNYTKLCFLASLP